MLSYDTRSLQSPPAWATDSQWPPAPRAADAGRLHRLMLMLEPSAEKGEATNLPLLFGNNPSCLLGRTKLGEPCIASLKVKNTFIECILPDEDEDDEDFGPPISWVKSCPAESMQASFAKTPALQAQPVVERTPAPAAPELDPASFEDEASTPTTISPQSQAPMAQQPPQPEKAAIISQPVFVMASPIVSFVPSAAVQQAMPNLVIPFPGVSMGPSLAPAREIVLKEDDDEQEAPTKPLVPLAQEVALASEEVVPLEIRKPSSSVGSTLHGTGNCRPCAWFWRPQGCSNGQDCRHCHMCSKGEVKARRRSKNSVSRVQKQRERLRR